MKRESTNSIRMLLETEFSFDPLTVLKIEYGLQVVKNESIKLIVLAFFYTLMDKGLLFLFSAGLLIPVRIFSGGLHMKTNITCFLFSFCFFAAALLLLPAIPLSASGYQLLLLFAVCTICLCAPIATTNKPIVSRSKYIRCKVAAILLTLAAAAILLYLPVVPLRNCGIWILFLQAVQLLAAFLIQKLRKGEGNPYEQI